MSIFGDRGDCMQQCFKVTPCHPMRSANNVFKDTKKKDNNNYD